MDMGVGEAKYALSSSTIATLDTRLQHQLENEEAKRRRERERMQVTRERQQEQW
jgi:hypothetical protein